MNIRAAVSQKQHERFLLERFFEDAALPAEVVEEREAPDFIVRFEDRFIGVEVTELFISHDTNRNLMQAQESISTRIVSRAQQIYHASGALPAHVSVCFDPGCDLKKLNRDHTANELASFVRSLNLAEWQRADWYPEECDGPLPHEISFVHALGVPSFDMAHWAVARAGWAAPLTADVLQARVDEKSTRLLKYRDIVRENWLVVVADATKPSGLFDARSQFDVAGLSSPFSRTFFYGYPDRAVIKLGA
jgi:hypothetical protein